MKSNKFLKVLLSTIMILCIVFIPAMAVEKEDISNVGISNSKTIEKLNEFKDDKDVLASSYPNTVYIREVFTSPAWVNSEGGYNYLSNGEKVTSYMYNQELWLSIPTSKVIEFNQQVSDIGQVQTGWITKITYIVDSEKNFFANIMYNINGGSMKSLSLLPGTYTMTFYTPITEDITDRHESSFKGYIRRSNGTNIAFWSGVIYN